MSESLPAWVTRLQLTLRREVRAEVRAAAILDPPAERHLPPPHDIEAERVVISAILDGHARVSAIGLRACDFYLPLHRDILVACEVAAMHPGAVDPERVVRVLGLTEHDAEQAHRAVVDLLDVPWHSPAELERAAARVRDRALARRLVSALEASAVALRIDCEPLPIVRERIAAVIEAAHA